MVGKGQMGSALMESLQFVFWRRDFSPFNLLFILPKVPGRTFPNLSKFIAFAAAPWVLTSFVRNQQENDAGQGNTGKRGRGKGKKRKA